MSTDTSKPPSGDYVLSNFRYLSAYNELVARIGQRQQSLALFVAIFTGLVTALILTREIFKSEHSAIVWLMIGFPMASLILTFLNYKYETLISLLRHHLADLERVKDAHLHFPSYNCDSGIMARANRARFFHDLTCAILILSYNTAAVGIYVSICEPSMPPNRLVTLGVGAVAFGCFIAHLWLRAIYYRPAAGSARPGADAGR